MQLSIVKVEQLLAAMRMEDKAEVQCGKLSEVNLQSDNLMNDLLYELNHLFISSCLIRVYVAVCVWL